MMFKKTLALIMAALMLFCGFGSAFAQNNERGGSAVGFFVSSVHNAAPGDMVSVSVSMDTAGNAVHGLVVRLFYDPERLTVISVCGGDLIDNGPEGAIVTFDHRTNPGELSVCVICTDEGISGCGGLFSVDFLVSEDCDEDQPLHLAADEVYYMPIGQSTPAYYETMVTDGAVCMAQEAPVCEYGLAEGFYFETDPAEEGWSFIDQDGDSYSWYWLTYDPERDQHDPAYEGVGCIASDSRYHAALTPDNAAVSEKVEIPYGNTELVFFARGSNPAYPSEHFAVMAGEELTEMTVIMEATVSSSAYCEYRCDLSAFAGMSIRIAFRHFDCSDMSSLVIDCAEIRTDEKLEVKYVGAYTGTDLVYYGRDAVLPTLGYDGVRYTFTANGEPWDGKNIRKPITVEVGMEIASFTVDFFDPIDGKIVSSQIVNYGESASAPEPPAHYGYDFVCWDGDLEYVTCDITVCAVYSPITFTVTFVGAYTGTQEVPYGCAAELPDCPTAGIHYEFYVDGLPWDGNCVEGDTLVTVLKAMNVYKVTLILDGELYGTVERQFDELMSLPEPAAEGRVFSGWRLEDGSRLPTYMPAHDITAYGTLSVNHYSITYTGAYNGTQMLEYGQDADLPVYEGEGMHYEFTVGGEPWDGKHVTMSVTVTVTLEVNIYTVTFFDPVEGKIVCETQAPHGGSAEAPEAPAHEHYEFICWDREAENITCDTVICAVYEAELMTVVFTDGMGSIIAELTVPYGTAAEPPETPIIEGYEFIGWDSDLSCIEQDMTVNAMWKEKRPIVTFTGVYSGQMEVGYGESIELPELDSDVLHYTFTVAGEPWYGVCITDDVTVTVGVAINALTFFTVTFLDWDGSVIKTEKVSYGMPAELPEEPCREGHVFIGWDNIPDCVKSDMIVTAKYQVMSFTLTVFYLFTDGSEAAPAYTAEYEYGSYYCVESPDLGEFTPDKYAVEGFMGAQDITVTVIYGRFILLGDADCDGDVDFDDVTLLNAYLLNAAEVSEEGIENSNVNGDNRISSADVVALNKLILGSK